MPKTLIVIAGPTGAGKTQVSIEIARRLNTEIVSADSRQIFKEMTIGTAVPSKKELAAVKHHFIQTHSLFEPYNAYLYENEAEERLGKLFKKYDAIVLTGGSMLYIDAICKGIDIMPDVDIELRNILNKRFKTEGIESLRLQLKQLDPVYYRKVDLKNHVRIIHALEICLATGRPYSSFLSSTQKRRSFKIIKTGLNCERAELHRRINSRTDKMVEAGLEKEAVGLYPYKHLNSLNTVGYREFFDYFDGKITKERAVELIKRNTRRYARKQITWFKKDPEINWFVKNKESELLEFINNKI